MEPEKVGTMMDELELKNLPPDKADHAAAARSQLLKEKRNGIIVGCEKLTQMHKRVGDRFTVTELNYKDIDLEFEVVGVFPDGRYDKTGRHEPRLLQRRPRRLSAVRTTGQKHPLADKSLNLVWLRVPDIDCLQHGSGADQSSPFYTQPAVKCETASSGIATFLEAYRDLIWGMRWLFAPAILLTLSLVIANAISISVRERRCEFAILARARLSAAASSGPRRGRGGDARRLVAGLVSATATYTVINKVFGGFNFPIAFFGAFFIPVQAIWWGLGVGVATALAGSVVPALVRQPHSRDRGFAKVA